MIGSNKPTTGRPKKGNYREGRERKLCIRISVEDLKKLNYICKHYQITKSDFIIDAIKSGFKEVKELWELY